MRKTEKKNFLTPFAIIGLVCLIIYSVSLIFPLGWSFLASLQDPEYFKEGTLGITSHIRILNYLDVLSLLKADMTVADGTAEAGVLMMLINSLWYSVGTALISTTVSFLVGYVVARFRFKFCEIIYTVVILQMIIPTVGTLPSEIQLSQDLQLYNTVYGVFFMKSYVTGLYFLAFYAALKVIPKDYAEAAYLDGAGNFRVMTRIMLPMASGVFTTVLLLNFITFWNDYQTPLIYMPSFPTLGEGIWYFSLGYIDGSSNIPIRLAACMIMAVPLIAIFFIFQKKLMGNVSLGGLK